MKDLSDYVTIFVYTSARETKILLIGMAALSNDWIVAGIVHQMFVSFLKFGAIVVVIGVVLGFAVAKFLI